MQFDREETLKRAEDVSVLYDRGMVVEFSDETARALAILLETGG